MVSVSELQAQVASRFERLDLPSWGDPHESRAQPRDEDYSRVTDPERYRITSARARLWAEVLVEVLGVRAEHLTPGSEHLATESSPREGSPRVFDRGVRLVSPQPGALPLLLLERDVPSSPGDVPMPVLEISVVRPDVVVETLPDCGCDACDSGSDQLLDVIDETIGHVVGGQLVVLRGPTWNARWSPSGSRASGAGRRWGRARPMDLGAVMDLSRRLGEGEQVRLPRHTEVFVCGSWLG